MEEDNKGLAAFQIVCIALASFLLPLIFITTIVDVLSRSTSWKPIKRASNFWNNLMIWSLYRNAKSLFMSKGGAFPFLSGIRVLCAYWVLLGHVFFFPIGLETANGETINFIKEIRKTHFWTPVENFTVAVDTFFFISGFLLFISTWKTLKMNNGKINLPLLLLHKYLRFSIGTVIFLIFVVIQYLLVRPNVCFFGLMMFFKEICSCCLWRNALFIQNYWTAMEICGPHTWFLALLLQYHILGLLIIYVIYRKKNIGIIIGSLLAIICPVVTYLILNHYRDRLEKLEKSEWFDLTKLQNVREIVYYLPCEHFGPYWFGMVTGYLLNMCHYPVMKKTFQWCAWVFSIICLASVVFCCHLSNTTDFRFWYESLHRTVWGIGLIWVVYACGTGNGGILNKFLSCKPFLVLGDISFLFYLLHPLIVLKDCCQHKGNFPLSVPYWIWRSFISTAISVCFSLLCHIGIEKPFLELEEALLYPLRRKTNVD